ncbi:MAG: LmbE family N-acetylglucosaminyl deacetylase [Saprospiraceae bacterium]|jgi:LmbE family N-acetylglucosaminyl deacetylase
MIKRYTVLLLIAFLFVGHTLNAQAPKKPTSADIHDGIKRLNVLGTALYLAAHPDDENTRLIAYISNTLRMNTGYLSLTRGDGGQNLIGSEIRELLGLIRTQELLGARRIDGGKQMFSRANDFGYSKHPDETLAIWNKEEVLSDVVWAIRKFKPDVIVNRFDHRSPGSTHGHHTSSAMLSFEAFEMAADPKVYPEQLQYVDVWQPQRLFFNTSWWFYGSREKFADADKSRLLSVDVGTYYPLKGKSNNEIAAESRSMHKSQGFGSTGDRGSQSEFLELLKGDMPSNKENPFAGINTTWSRVQNGAAIGELVSKIDGSFKHDNPAESIVDLIQVYKKIQQLKDGYWKDIKLAETKELIKACLGLYIEAVANESSATPGQQIELAIEAINRTDIEVVLNGVYYLPMDIDSTLNLTMEDNQEYKFYQKITLPADMPLTTPYWLNNKASLGMYAVEDQRLRGLPETPRSFQVRFNMKIDGTAIDFTLPVVYKKNDPVDGEVYQPFEVIPPVFSKIEESVYVFPSDEPQMVKVLVKSGRENIKAKVQLCVPNTWKVEPALVEIDLKLKGAEETIDFTVYPCKEQEVNFIVPMVNVDSVAYSNALTVIEYDHIPTQSVLQDASAKVVKIDLQKAGDKIGYIMGPGDEIPQNLEQIGYQVSILDDKDINAANLKKFDAVIMGVRAYNTEERLKYHQEKLMEYVENGGTMIVQYNTNRGLKVKELGPYPFKISRDRVAMEDAEIRLLKPDHEVLNFPNKITQKDFEGWVQERGLYFPDEWDEQYEAILSSNDIGETPKDGGLLVAKFGKGYYIYTGYSWFRELPAGVPGAYRLFANLISIGKKP